MAGKRSKVSRRLVLDASVARAAGGEGAEFPLSKRCRDCLKSILEVCHRVMFPTAIQGEWNNHQSRFARRWRAAMVARKKLLVDEVPEDQSLRDALEAAAPNKAARLAMLKDAHLLEAALAADCVIISADNKAWKLFTAARAQVKPIKKIEWANPADEEDGLVGWLESGTSPRK